MIIDLAVTIDKIGDPIKDLYSIGTAAERWSKNASETTFIAERIDIPMQIQRLRDHS